MVYDMKYLPDSIWQTRCLGFDDDAYTNLCHVGETNESKGNKIKDFESFIMFFIHLNKQNTGVLGWPFKLLKL